MFRATDIVSFFIAQLIEMFGATGNVVPHLSVDEGCSRSRVVPFIIVQLVMVFRAKASLTSHLSVYQDLLSHG